MLPRVQNRTDYMASACQTDHLEPLTWVLLDQCHAWNDLVHDPRIRIYIHRRTCLGLWAAALSAPPPETPSWEVSPRNPPPWPAADPVFVVVVFSTYSRPSKPRHLQGTSKQPSAPSSLRGSGFQDQDLHSPPSPSRAMGSGIVHCCS